MKASEADSNVESDKGVGVSNIIETIEWAEATIDNKLMFGMEDAPLQAGFAREQRARGVLLDCRLEIQKLKAAIELYKKSNDFYADTSNWGNSFDTLDYSLSLIHI